VIVAATSILESFDEFVLPLRNKMFSNSQLVQTLTQLRDTQLPRLISGQLRLPEAEELVEEACA
jgi:type I restriction enzyme S subunit